MVCPLLLKCLATGKKKSFILIVWWCSTKTISESPLGFSKVLLITFLTGKTINNSYGDKWGVMGNKKWSFRACDYAVLMNLHVEYLEWLHAKVPEDLLAWSLLHSWQAGLSCFYPFCRRIWVKVPSKGQLSQDRYGGFLTFLSRISSLFVSGTINKHQSISHCPSKGMCGGQK